MKKIFLLISIIVSAFAYGQAPYKFYIELKDYKNAPNFVDNKGKLLYSGKDLKEAKFFSEYDIKNFYQAFPSSRWRRNLNIFIIETSSQNLVDKMLSTFPQKYLSAVNISGNKIESLDYYPNDYGNTSPGTNLGVNANFKNYDYINVPKAWDYTLGSEEIVIGISDGGIVASDIDLMYKTTFLDNYAADISHGTSVAAIAAAQGDNANAMTGVCSNCSVHSSGWGYDKVLQQAYAGANVINMSWKYSNYFIPYEQEIINEVDSLGVIMVAASGNDSPWHYGNPQGVLNYYPASYNHVISVAGVNHKNAWSEEVVMEPAWGEVSLFVEDMISPSVVTNYQGNGPYPFYVTFTINPEVDICAPGYQFFRYYPYITNQAIEYAWGGTSGAAPHVSGTIGLMLDVNNCLKATEVEDILQLTSKNVEALPGNEPWAGMIGSGKMETGDAVEFTHEMKDSSGNALIDGHDFYRFNFDLYFNNKLTISNQLFRDNCTAEFTAINEIEILPGSDFKPNNNGLVDLIVDSEYLAECNQVSNTTRPWAGKKEKLSPTAGISIIYPNPNGGNFTLQLDKERKNVSINIYDIYGKIIYNNVMNDVSVNINLPNIASGLYVVKLVSENYNETIKFIKK